MITFEGGPVDGQTLALRRAPLFLRLVGWGGQWDGLDLLSDAPKAAEVLYAYERIGKPFRYHLLARGRRGVSGFYQRAHYRFIVDQPTDEVMRSTAAWREWCMQRQREVAT